MDEMIEITKTDLAEAFKIWVISYQKDPSRFDDLTTNEPDVYSERMSDYFFEKIKIVIENKYKESM